MHAELQCSGKAIGLDGVGDDCEIVVEFLFEPGEVAHIVDSLVEATGEFWSDGLDGEILVGNGGQNDEHLGRGLGIIGFIHGDLGDEVLAVLRPGNVAINAAGEFAGLEKLSGRLLDVFTCDPEGSGDALDLDGSDQLGVPVDEGRDFLGGGRCADVVRNVDGIEITVGKIAVNGSEVDVVRVQEVVGGPAETGHGGIGGGTRARRLGTDDEVFAIGLVPDRGNWNAPVGELLEGPELGLRLVGEAVTHSESEFIDGFHW